MGVKVTKGDVLWNYVAQFFNIGAGFITLPLILSLLSTEEIAMNYLMLTVGTMVALIDFGFAPQFGRNVTYVFSGAQSLEKEGINCEYGIVNYHLLKCLIDVAKRVYSYMSLIAVVLMMTIGTWYIYNVTNGFTNVKNAFLIWCLFSLSTFFNIYFFYYTSLLTGRGQIMESKKAMMAQKISYIVLAYILLLSGMGLIGVCIANLLSPFVGRWLCYHYFYDKELKEKLLAEQSSRKEQMILFHIIWYNAKKLGINFIGAYAILKFSLFIAGLYLSMAEVASYGLMIQLVGIISGLSMAAFTALMTQISSYRVEKKKDMILKTYAMSVNIYALIFVAGSLSLIIIVPPVLNLIGAKAALPITGIVLLYLLVSFLEGNHSMAASFITTGNEVPFVKAAISSGIIICILDILVLQFTNWGLWGVVAVQGIVQLSFNNWYWPRWTYRELNVTPWCFACTGISETFRLLKNCF